MWPFFVRGEKRGTEREREREREREGEEMKKCLSHSPPPFDAFDAFCDF